MSTEDPTHAELRARVAAEAPTFIEAIAHNKDGKSDGIILTIGAFIHEPELLHDALLLAYHEGVGVILAPNRGDES